MKKDLFPTKKPFLAFKSIILHTQYLGRKLDVLCKKE